MSTPSNDPVRDKPMTVAEIEAALDDDGSVSGLVAIDLADLIDGDLDSVLDLMSERLVGSVCGMDIDYTPVSVDETSTLIVRVTLDPSMILDDAGEG